jgi:hypothetical protein
MKKYKGFLMDGDSNIPNVILVGVQKAGTSSLYDWIGQHPDVYAIQSMKDYNFFCNTELLKLGLDWFSRSFSGKNKEKIVLHGYVKYIVEVDRFIESIKVLPRTPKIIVSLRNPTDRAYSAFWEAKKTARETLNSFEESVFYDGDFRKGVNESSDYIRLSTYYDDLIKLMDFFGSENVLLVNFNDIKSDKAGLISSIYQFLGVNNEFVPDFVYVNESGLPRSLALQKFFQRISLPLWFKRIVPGRYTSYMKRLLVRKLNVRKAKYPKINPQTAEVLNDYFTEHNRKVEALFNLKLDME